MIATRYKKSLPHRYVGYVSSPHLVRPVDCLAAQEVWVDLVPGMPLAGIPLRSDRPQPELSHQPPDAPAALQLDDAGGEFDQAQSQGVELHDAPDRAFGHEAAHRPQ